MGRMRAQAIILRGQMALFAYGRTSDGGYRHSFIGGRIEDGEDPEAAVLREVAEEASLHGRAVFRIPEAERTGHFTYLVDIGGQEPRLGANPEEQDLPLETRHLQQLLWLDLNAADRFTSIDRRYFGLLLDECRRRRYRREWTESLYRLVGRESPRDD